MDIVIANICSLFILLDQTNRTTVDVTTTLYKFRAALLLRLIV